MAENINLGITIDAKAANNAIKGLERSFDALKLVAGAAVAAFAGGKVIKFLEQGIDAANKQQTAMAQLGQQLKLTGEFSKGAIDSFGKFADEMEKTTKYGDDVILNQLAIAKSFGISNDKAKLLVKAATELSAATGKDLEGSVRQLGLTFSGVTGKLDEQIPALRGLSKEALASGRALEIVVSRFGGSAAAELDTFAGSVTQTENAFGNLQESIGALIVDNPAFIVLIKAVGDALSSMSDYISENSGAIKDLMNDGIQLLLKGLAATAPVLKILVGNFQSVFEATMILAGGILQVVSAFMQFGPVSAFVKSFGIGVTTMVSTVVNGLGILYAGFQGIFELIGAKAPESIIDFAALSLKIDGLGESLANADLVQVLDNSTQGLANFAESGKSAFTSIGSGIDSTAAKLNSLASNISSAGSQVAAATSGGGGGGGMGNGADFGPSKDLMAAPPKAKSEKDPTAQLLMKLGGNLASGIGGGADGAKQFMSAAAGGIADAFVPGMGQIVGPLVDTLQQGPEAVKGLVNGFADAIPDLLDSIVDAIPVLIETIADRIPDLIVAFVSAIPRIVVALIKAFSNPQLYLGIVRGLLSAFIGGLNFNMGNIAKSFTQVFQKIIEFDKKIREGIINFFKNAFNKFNEFDRKIREGIINGLKNAFNGLKNMFGKAMDLNNRFKGAVDAFIKGLLDGAQKFIDKLKGGKGGGGFIGQVSRGSKSAGGKVSEKYKETFGMALTGDVQPMTTAGSVPPEGFTIDDVVLILIQIRDQLAMPVTATAKAMVNDKVLADIILDLSRRNARLTA